MKLSVWGGLLAFFCVAEAVVASTHPAICVEISEVISPASEVFYPGDALYEKGVSHYAISSTEQSECVVEAGSPADVGKILVILGRTRTPFAVKGGGHATNPQFSSTKGVHISMYRFSRIQYDPSSSSAIVGAGLIFDDVYAALEPFGVNVLGGRVTGIGVAGFTLGGGYSWTTNQYGLAIDNVLAFELVKPDGQVVQVTQASDPELFFGLKGGQNNFGVVTEFTLKAHPQTQVWGGSVFYHGEAVDAVTAATVAFQAVTDPKAALITTYNYVPALATGQVITSAQLFYDAPNPPPGIFDAFLNISSFQSDVSTRTFFDMIRASPGNVTEPTRMQYQYLPNLQFTPGVAELLVNETLAMGSLLTDKTAVLLSYDVEIFLPSIYSHNTGETAFPPVRSIPFQPFNMAYEWNSSEFDQDFRNALIASQKRIVQGEIALGQDVDNVPWYPNYASAGTPLQNMYGANMPALQALKMRVDPENVMGLAGGWKF